MDWSWLSFWIGVATGIGLLIALVIISAILQDNRDSTHRQY